MKKYDKGAIMRSAWSMYKLIKSASFLFSPVSFADCLKKAWSDKWMFEIHDPD